MKGTVAVIGGGWAGLAAAVELAANGVGVTLFESARQPGGRARAVRFEGLTVDNGQHLLIGGYHETRRLLRTVGVDEGAAFERWPLRLELFDGDQRIALRAPPLPAPLHLAWAIWRAEGLGRGERVAALRLAARLLRSRFTLPRDLPLARFLAAHGQPPRLVRRLWEPLCLAMLNTPVDEASSTIFLRVLHDAFAVRRADSDLLLPRHDLGTLFPWPATRFVESRGGAVKLARRVTALRSAGSGIAALTVDGREVEVERLIVAASPNAAAALLAPHAPALALQIEGLGGQPVTTLYLRYPGAARLPSAMVGLCGGVGQWVFDHGVTGRPGLLAVVISGPGRHMELEREDLAREVARELDERLALGTPEASLVIRERRATFHCDAGVGERRPGHATPFDNCWLAGDYTDTGYPATLEGAVRSGIQCARLILAQTGSVSS